MNSLRTLHFMKGLGLAPFAPAGGGPVYKGVDSIGPRTKELIREWQAKGDKEFASAGLIKPPIAFPTWDRTTPGLRAVYYMRYLLDRIELGGALYAFTLNPSAEVIDGAWRSGISINKRMQERIARALKARFGHGDIEFWFSTEISAKKGRPRLHGCIEVQLDTLPRIREALLSASHARGTKPEPRALVMEPITDAAGWADYANKSVGRTKRVIDGKLLSASFHLREAAQVAYEADRRAHRFVVALIKSHPAT